MLTLISKILKASLLGGQEVMYPHCSLHQSHVLNFMSSDLRITLDILVTYNVICMQWLQCLFIHFTTPTPS